MIERKHYIKKMENVIYFFDEIQVLENWQDTYKTLRLYAYSIFITGSNSKLLSKEFTKELSGRYVFFQIIPFIIKRLSNVQKNLVKILISQII